MKKYLFFVVLALFASLCTASAASGTCGDNLTWDLTDGVLTISGTGAMSDYNKSSNVPWFSSGLDIKVVVIKEGVTSIGDYAFNGCSGLTSVTIPNSVTSIGVGAFYHCSGLTSVSIPNSVTSIGQSSFSGCSGLTSVTIPNSVTGIGYYAFSDCIGLTSVSIGNNVTSICGRAFFNCSALTSVTIPNSVTSIGEYAFSFCSGLTSVTIPNSVTSIGEGAFSYCSGLTTAIIGGNITSAYERAFIDDMAFRFCSSLSSVSIGNNIISIGNYAFEGCSSLISVTIPNSVEGMGRYAFSDVLNIVYSGSAPYYPWGARSVNGFVDGYLVYSDSKRTKLICCSPTIVGEVTIPNSVTNIDALAFSDCYGLKEVHISDLAAWCKIGFGSSSANPLCYAHDLYLNGVLVTDLLIPNGVTSIGKYAFYDCSSLTSITIPNSVTSIGDYAFYSCNNFNNLYINNTIPPIINSTTFKDTNVFVHVSFSSLGNFLSAEYWEKMKFTPNIIQNHSVTPTSICVEFETEGVDLLSCGIEDGEQQFGNILEYVGLEPNSEYKDVPFVLISTIGESTTLKSSFTTSALELTTQPSKPVSSNTAILLAETNMADIETSCGFEWRRNDQPEDMASNQVICPVANGLMAGRLKGLKDDVYYKYRAFYKSAAGNMYYGDWQYIFTGDVAVEFDPILYTYEASNVQETQARLRGYALAGSDDFTEQGFEYWADSRAPKANDKAYAPQTTHENIGERHTVQASGISMAINLQNLDAGTVYHYRTYAKIGSQTLYGAEMSFTTKGEYTPPTYTILFVNYDGSPLLTLSEVEHGTMPVYTGDTPIRDEDAQYTYTFSGWEPEVVAAVADATYTATYTATPKTSGIGQLDAQSAAPRKVIENGNLYIILSDGKKYDAGGKLTK